MQRVRNDSYPNELGYAYNSGLSHFLKPGK
jgi:hypothetical protein